jgi:hypothetical protein
VLRIVGFGRCLSVPKESRAWGLAAILLGAEIVLVLGLGLLFLGGLVHPLVSLAGWVVTAGAAVLALLFLLLFFRQVGIAMNSRQLPAQVVNFGVWFVGGFVGIAAVCGGYFLLVYALRGSPPSAGKSWAQFGSFLFLIGVCLTVPLTLLVKYLGLFNLARDEIRKRAKLRKV